ncbi:hypothetical protein E2C11_23160 [Streptomyces lavendulae]|nr:hypothetical protein [Streptomyces lavendulae]TXJ75414.1 hypothetical protein E2C11_23160 [Streptomyces lavendulae]
MIEYIITDVGEDPERSLWYVQYEDADGNAHTHIFPKATMEWRAAEYGLTDPAEILDVILHEPHTPDPTPRSGFRSLTNPAQRAAVAPEPVTLYTATSTGEARDAHLERIEATKAATVCVTNPPSDPLAVIREARGITVDGLRAKREFVDTSRWCHLYGGLPVEVPDPTDPSSTALEVPDA